jgi:hypothetical protein
LGSENLPTSVKLLEVYVETLVDSSLSAVVAFALIASAFAYPCLFRTPRDKRNRESRAVASSGNMANASKP